MPVSVMGLSEVPNAGEIFRVVESERGARDTITQHRQENEAVASAPKTAITLEQLFDRFQAGEVRELRLIIKADVQGSLEPIVSTLNDMGKGEININILHAETGNITENDVMLAAASKAVVWALMSRRIRLPSEWRKQKESQSGFTTSSTA